MTTSDRKELDSEWRRKGATLSDKTARKELRLTQDEIVQAIRARKLHYRVASMHGNPWFRLLRREVEALVKRRHGDDYQKDQQAKTELGGINRGLKPAEDAGRCPGRAEGKADGRSREVTASTLLSREERGR